jgi:hypothetical protein
MGTWSRPIFTTAPSAVIRPAELSEMAKDIIGGCLMEDKDGDLMTKESFTMGELMAHVCETSKIMGYFTPRLMSSWKELLLLAIRSNYGLAKIECHFYCRDDAAPFYFVATDDGNCWAHVYSHGDMKLHFANIRKADQPGDDEGADVVYEFNDNKYKSQYTKVGCEVRSFDIYTNNPSLFWQMF